MDSVKKTTYLTHPWPAGGCILHLIRYFWLTTWCPECILFISPEVSLVCEITAHVCTCSRVSCIVPEFSTTKCACSHLRSRDIWALMRFLALASDMEFRSISRCSCRSSSLQASRPRPITTLTIYSSKWNHDSGFFPHFNCKINYFKSDSFQETPGGQNLLTSSKLNILFNAHWYCKTWLWWFEQSCTELISDAHVPICRFLLHSRRFCSYLLTLWGTVLLEKPLPLQVVKKFHAFYGTWRFITAFMNACHRYLSWLRSIQPAPSHPIF
jgi:hypothetical protein